MKTVLILNHNQENVGTYYRCLAFGNAMVLQGFNVKMICASGKKLDLLIRKKEVTTNFTIYTLPRVKYHRYFTGQLVRLFLTCILVFVLRFDICHAFTIAQPQIAIPGWMVKVCRKKPLIVDWDDMWGGGFAEEHNSLIAKVLSWHERFFLQFADKITYVSEYIREEIERVSLRYPKIQSIEKIKIPNGTNPDLIPILDPVQCRNKLGIKHKTVLLSVGNTYTKSLKVLLGAFDILRKSRSEVYLYLVGGALIPDEYRELFKKNQDHIVVTGRVPNVEIPCYLGAADVLLLPMEENAIEKARFPMRLGDYLCAGRPIVSNAVGEVRYYLEEYKAGMVSNPTSEPEFANCVTTVLEDPALSQKLSFRARHLAENDLRWTNIFSKLENLYSGMG